VVQIKTLIEEMSAKGLKGYEIAERLGVSNSMVSSYTTQGFDASFNVAVKVYQDMKIVLHPFAEESLIYEINKRGENAKLRRA